jgi:prepilin-type N-terminal cleavage/methylation domain-containing protein
LKTKKNLQSGFTLIETIIVVIILGILVTLAVPQISKAKSDAVAQEQKATAKTLNETVVRVIVKELDGIGSSNDWQARFGTNVTNAVGFMISNGLIRN